MGTHTEFWWESQKEQYRYEDIDVGGRIILKWILEKYDEMIRNGFTWIGIGTSGGLL
jgi:TnpA family transposase